MPTPLLAWRNAKNIIAQALATLAALLGLFFLAWILWTTLSKGLASIHLALFTQMTPPPGGTGGMLNAFFGSVVMSVIGIVLGAPIGILSGTYQAEYARIDWLGETIRQTAGRLLRGTRRGAARRGGARAVVSGAGA